MPMCTHVDALWGSSWRREGFWELSFAYLSIFSLLPDSEAARNFDLKYRFLLVTMSVRHADRFRYARTVEVA